MLAQHGSSTEVTLTKVGFSSWVEMLCLIQNALSNLIFLPPPGCGPERHHPPVGCLQEWPH